MQSRCIVSGESFAISEADMAFYRSVEMPHPVLSPDERQRRRLSWRNERNLYRRSCSATGKPVVSIFSAEKTMPVYSQDYWWSDKWNAKEFAVEFDFSRPFFEQFVELYYRVPQLALNNAQSENSEFTNQSQNNKNCYLVVASNFNEDCLYGMWYQNCRDSLDCLYLEQSELCYEVLSGKQCYHCTFSENLENCSDCHFSKNCIGCKYCFGCFNLRNREYCFFGEQFSRTEYQRKLAELSLHTYSGLEKIRERFQAARLTHPHKFYVGSMNEDFSGDYLHQVKNTFESYNCRDCEEVRYSRDAWKARNCFDLTETLDNDFCMELEGCDGNRNAFFSMKLHHVHDTMYSGHCFFSRNLFGCVGIRNGQYLIFNKQYSQAEYEAILTRIVTHMKETGEWGQHFPTKYSPFGYNETVAQEYFPLTRDEVLQRGWKWKEEQKGITPLAQPSELSDSIEAVTDELLDQVLVCRETGKPYRVLKKELEFYRSCRLPIPRFSPDVRHHRRMNLRNPRKLFVRECDQCHATLQTTFAPGREERIYCEKCYGQFTVS